jgi:hypothetical protein
MRKLRLVSLVFVCVSLLAAGTAHASLISTAPSCGTSFDPFDYTPQALSACGIQTFPLTSQAALPGGGTTYNYDEGNGVVVSVPVPPTGFDPLTATAAQLAEYGIPTAADLNVTGQSWTELMTHAQAAPPPPFQVSLPNVHADTTYTSVWSGYADTGSAGQFIGAESLYQEPSFNNYTCPGSQEVTWAGIGGYSGSSLGQDGTAHYVSGLANHQAWYEVYPLETIQALNLVSTASHYVLATTGVSFSPTTYGFIVYDLTTDTYASTVQTVSPSYYSGDSAEGIGERPSYGYVPTSLSNFGALTFVGSYGMGTNGVWEGLDTGTRHGIHMTSNGLSTGTPLAAPGGIGAGGAFTDTWQNCS